MAISDKLNYLIETKSKFKDRLNSLGAEIIESTTFRNYLNWLDTFYGDVSDKTDLSVNGVVGRTSQDGDPTPENPVEINNLSGDVEYRVGGKNLFNKGNYIELNGTPNTSGIFTGGGANYNIVIPCQPNTTYTIQKRNDGNTNRFAFFCSETIPSDADSVQTQILNGTRNDTASEITITTASTAKYLIAHYYRNVETALTKQQLLDSIQIEESSTATPYEPYISESFPLSLGDIELCAISDYKDRIYSQNGEFYLEKKNGKVVLDGSETWNKNNYAFQSLESTTPNKGAVWLNAYSNYYTHKYYASAISTNIQNGEFGWNSGKIITIRNDSCSTANDFKSWLSTHNTEVEYVLATPTTTEITQENYPTLYSQLLAIQEFLTKYKINKEFLLDYSSPEIEY